MPMFACIHCHDISRAASLKDFAYGFSPLVEETSEDTVVIDAAGCEVLFGSAYELANQISARAATPPGLGLSCKVNVALADNPDTAIYAARFFEGVTFISPGEELSSLGELPIEKLSPGAQAPNHRSRVSGSENTQPSLKPSASEKSREREIDEIIETLKRWGIHTFGEFARLPVAGVSERLGQTGVKLQQLAGGKTERNLKLPVRAPIFADSIELEYPITTLEPLSFLLARLLNQVCANLNAYALATNEIRLCLKLENGLVHERKLSLPYPMRDPRVFLRLLLLDAEAHPPQSAVTALNISCEPVKPRLLQNGLFIPLAPEPEKLELTLARLAKLLGANNVGALRLLDTHRPEAFNVARFVLKDVNKKTKRAKSGMPKNETAQCLPAFRTFRPPLRAIVQTEKGCPVEISAWSVNRSVHGIAIQIAGPWRTTGDWWRSDGWARDEWDVAIASRSQLTNFAGPVLYRICRELRDDAWFVTGVYD
jgi:protein ImuB